MADGWVGWLPGCGLATGLAPLLALQGLPRWLSGRYLIQGQALMRMPGHLKSAPFIGGAGLRRIAKGPKGTARGLFAFPYKLVSRWIRLDLMGGLTDGSDTATWGFPRNLFFFSGGLRQWIVNLLSCKPALTVFRRPPVIGTVSYPVPCACSDYRAL